TRRSIRPVALIRLAMICSSINKRGNPSGTSKISNLAKPTDKERVSIRSIKAEYVQPWSARREVNLLTNPKNRGIHRNLQKPGCLSIGSGGVHFFVGMADLNPILVLQY